MALIDLDEFKDVLGIGDIYADPIVQEVADAAENIILSYLTFNSSAIAFVQLTDNVAIYTTSAPHDFVVGSALTVSGCGTTFNGSVTVTEKGKYFFKAAKTASDVVLTPIKPSGKAILTSQAALFDTTPEIREAALAVGVDIWITRQGTLGQQGVDFQPAPYRLGRSLMSRVSGLLAKHLDVGGLVG